MMQTGRPAGRVTYEPNSIAPEAPPAFSAHPGETGPRTRPRPFPDPASQARLFWHSQCATEKGHIVKALVFELGKLTLPDVRLRMLSLLRCIDETLGQRVADELGEALPPAASLADDRGGSGDPAVSDALSILAQVPPVKGHVIGLLVCNGADDATVAAVTRAAEAKEVAVRIIAPRTGGVVLASGQKLIPDLQLDGSPSVLFDAVALVLSDDGARHLAQDKNAVAFVADAFVHLKAIAHSPAAFPLLTVAGVQSDSFILPLPEAAKELVARVSQRHWSREASMRGPE